MENKSVTTLTDVVNTFLMSANGLTAVGKLSNESTFRGNLQEFCGSIGLDRNIFDHVELDESLKEAQSLPVEVQHILSEGSAESGPNLTLVH